MEEKIMDDWEKYKIEAAKKDPFAKRVFELAEIQANIIKAVIAKRNSENLSQRDLAKLCGIPQSTLARIERGVVVPNLDTLLKVMHPLGLSLKIVSE